MKKLTNKDIDMICAMAEDATGSHIPVDAEEELAEIKRIKRQMKTVLKFARSIRDGRLGLMTAPECV